MRELLLTPGTVHLHLGAVVLLRGSSARRTDALRRAAATARGADVVVVRDASWESWVDSSARAWMPAALLPPALRELDAFYSTAATLAELGCGWHWLNVDRDAATEASRLAEELETTLVAPRAGWRR